MTLLKWAGVAAVVRWRRRRRCMHGRPAPGVDRPPGESYVRSEGIVDWRKLYRCNETVGGCGRTWVE